MRRKTVVAAVICFFSLFEFVSAQGRNTYGNGTLVSLIRLIANPQAFDGRRVRIAGYVDNNGLDRAVGIYVTEADGRNFVMANSIDLEIEESTARKLMGKYVIMDATFHAPAGPLAEYTNGRFDHVSGIRLLNQGDPLK